MGRIVIVNGLPWGKPGAGGGGGGWWREAGDFGSALGLMCNRPNLSQPSATRKNP